MSLDKTFNGLKKQGGSIPDGDFTKYGKWTPTKLFFLGVVFSAPYFAFSIYLYVIGLKLISVILLIIISLILLSSWFFRKTLLRK